LLADEATRLSLPRAQWALTSLATAVATDLPRTFGTTQCGALFANVTVTEWSLVIESTQAPVPAQSPDQPAKRDFRPGVAVRVTAVPCVNVATQVEPQLMPAGELVTVPVPRPAFVTVSV
jgi:hypothetical protein